MNRAPLEEGERHNLRLVELDPGEGPVGLHEAQGPVLGGGAKVERVGQKVKEARREVRDEEDDLEVAQDGERGE